MSAALALSVEAQRLDNQRLERLLAELQYLNRLPVATSPPHRGAPPTPRRPREPEPEPEPEPERRRRRLAARRAAPARACGRYGYSLDTAFHRWRRRLVGQGVMAPLAGWRRYWAHWQIHSAAKAFCGLRAQCRLRALGEH